MSREPHSPIALLAESVRRLFADEAVPLAGNIAFRSVFSLFPFLIFLTALAGFFGNEVLAQTAVTFLLGVMPEQIARPLAGEIRNILTVPRADLLSLAALQESTVSGLVSTVPMISRSTVQHPGFTV
jgi:membrane protein